LLDPVILGLGARGHEEIKGSLKDSLGIVGEINPAIPASCSQSEWRVRETLVGEAHRHIICIDQRNLIYFIVLRIIL
jgi:hypothetical protein